MAPWLGAVNKAFPAPLAVQRRSRNRPPVPAARRGFRRAVAATEQAAADRRVVAARGTRLDGIVMGKHEGISFLGQSPSGFGKGERSGPKPGPLAAFKGKMDAE